MAGLYIHIPFCESRCIYCGFYSTTSLKLRDDYTDALCREMQMRPAKAALGSNETIETIYLGGGTPSQPDFLCYQKKLYAGREYGDHDGMQSGRCYRRFL